MEIHGKVRVDPYYWMRDDQRQEPEVLQYLRDENQYTQACLAPFSKFQEELFKEIVARIPQDDQSVPYLKDGYYYYSRQEAGKEYSIYCRKENLESPERVILDANLESGDSDYFRATSPKITRDGRVMAFGEDRVSRRIYTLRFRDLASGEDLPDRIEGTAGSGVWANDNKTFFYTKKDPKTLRAYQVWRHRLGTAPAEDALVFQEDDEEFEVYLSLSRSREIILISTEQTLTTEYLGVDANAPESKAEVLVPRSKDHECFLDHYDGRFYIRTNWQARNFRLMSVSSEQIANRQAWQVEIPHREDTLLGYFEMFDDFYAVSETHDGLENIRLLPRGENEIAEITFEEEGYSTYFGTNPDPASRVFRLSYYSMATPRSVYDFDVFSGKMELKKQAQVVGDFQKENYRTKRLEATARDGTPVTISLVWHKKLALEQPQPLLLYAYGSYGSTITPAFRSSRLSLLDRGVIFAIAHVRGGEEKGRKWYEDGKLLNKMNTFTDFIDCADYLIESGWTSKDQLMAQGGSAGGLLMGAVVNMKPEIFRGVVADVPFVDVVTTMLDPTIPLTTFEYDEWGNPEEEVYYDYMMGYSPYDNVSRPGLPGDAGADRASRLSGAVLGTGQVGG